MRIGVDAGGTFTDFVVLNDAGELSVFKLRSDPSNPAAVILRGIQKALESSKGAVEIVHGSTVATNALLERKGARTAFIASPGFRDLLALGRQNRVELYSLLPRERINLVPYDLTAEWDGNAESLRIFVHNSRAESAAICLINAFADSAEEESAERALAGNVPYVCRSSEIAPEFREYERASTTVLNAYVGPLMDRYLGQLERECPHPIHIMQSSGGLLSAGEARRYAVRTILSGPAGGVVGARAMALGAGFAGAIAFDMGGTSTDVSPVENPFRFATEAWVEGLPVRVPLLDIHTVGAGGGSLASVDAGGRLRVGPESAGANPGPACYGAGTQATVTDAHVVLGRILPDRFLDGSIAINPQRADRAVAEIARRLGIGVREAAQAIIRIANSNMERAIRAVSVEKGRDPREFPLVAFGGCGGLHACEIAAELGMQTVMFPPYAGVLSALGMLLAPRSRDYASGALGKENAGALFARLRARAEADSPSGTISEYADIRYRGQSYEITVNWNAENPREPFETAYRQIYRFEDPRREIEIVTVRVRTVEQPDTRWFSSGKRHPAAQAGPKIDGGSLWFDYGSTIFIPDGWSAAASPGGTLIARRAKDFDALLGGAKAEVGPQTG